MPLNSRGDIALALAGVAGLLLLGACGSSSAPSDPASASASPTGSASVSASQSGGSASVSGSGSPSGSVSSASPSGSAQSSSASAGGVVRLGFAGDVHFALRTADRLANDPKTVFGPAVPGLSAPDLTMVNLETAISVGGQAENKAFTFQAPPSAFTALKAAGIDLVSMANNHSADYGSDGLAQTFAAIKRTRFPVVGIGANAREAYAPYYTEINGVRLAFIAAHQVREETLANFTATDADPGVASAYSERLPLAVRAAKAKADAVIVYLHWGTEYVHCPNTDQTGLADRLAEEGATAVVGTHAHGLQGAGWRPDGTYIAYGLGNYLWWYSFGDGRDDTGVLTLTLTGDKVTGSSFAPARLDERGIAVPATGETASRIRSELEQFRQCADLLPAPPR
ncbi:MAG TPA: CapA family protein [Jatrophihabitans sp.]|jgi:poly-gamma-glutamate synthesis protein (capsule biosynthesis protein)|uniref:CapA family protein n=1 Tax=Jatrophihabitans sp. TaxID=1932789 RepID=UPI002EF9EBDF